MSSTAACLIHLLSRLNVLQAHVLDLAGRLDQQRVFAEEIAAVAESARRAQAERTKNLVERAIQEHRDLARKLYQAAKGESQAVPEVLASRENAVYGEGLT